MGINERNNDLSDPHPREILLDGSDYDYFQVITDEQTSGYGRNQSLWLNQKGNLFTSIAFRSEELTPFYQHFVAISLIRILKNASKQCKNGLEFRIKWPNDIHMVLDGWESKIGGILCESHQLADFENSGLIVVIMGIGLNTRNGFDAEGIQKLPDDVFGAFGHDNEIFVSEMLGEFDDLRTQELDFVELKKEYDSHLSYLGDPVILSKSKNFDADSEAIEGVLRGLNRYGGVDIESHSEEKSITQIREMFTLRRKIDVEGL